MGRQLNRLSARAVATVRKPGRYADGGGLYLYNAPHGGRRWVFVYVRHRKRTELGFGAVRDVTLAAARKLRDEARAMLAAGGDPRQVRKPREARTFGEVADQVIQAMKSSWRNEKHGAQWKMTLEKYAAPLRSLLVDKITTDDVLAVLGPLWKRAPETASRLRGRIERVLDAARAQGLRAGENPARWRGHLDQLLPKRQRLTRGHHAAMPYADVPSFMNALRGRQSTAALALELTILTNARTKEALGARWDELDLEAAVWTVPPQRMKGGREHRVPLSKRALSILKAMHEARDGEFVFPGHKPGRALSNMAMAMVLRRMKIDGAVVHGFRSTFRTWAAERTNFAHEVCEAALAHTIKNRVEAAYQRGDLFDKRRKLMDAWAEYCATPQVGKVVKFQRKA